MCKQKTSLKIIPRFALCKGINKTGRMHLVLMCRRHTYSTVKLFNRKYKLKFVSNYLRPTDTVIILTVGNKSDHNGTFF